MRRIWNTASEDSAKHKLIADKADGVFYRDTGQGRVPVIMGASFIAHHPSRTQAGCGQGPYQEPPTPANFARSAFKPAEAWTPDMEGGPISATKHYKYWDGHKAMGTRNRRHFQQLQAKM